MFWVGVDGEGTSLPECHEMTRRDERWASGCGGKIVHRNSIPELEETNGAWLGRSTMTPPHLAQVVAPHHYHTLRYCCRTYGLLYHTTSNGKILYRTPERYHSTARYSPVGHIRSKTLRHNMQQWLVMKQREPSALRANACMNEKKRPLVRLTTNGVREGIPSFDGVRPIASTMGHSPPTPVATRAMVDTCRIHQTTVQHREVELGLGVRYCTMSRGETMQGKLNAEGSFPHICLL